MASHTPQELSISGAWVLDLSRSETFEGYLRYLGTPEDTIRAQVVGERAYQSRNVIALSDSSLAIHKDTVVNKYTDKFKLDEQRVTVRSDGGVSQATASLGDRERLDGYVVVTTVSAPRGRIVLETVEARQLLEGGLTHIQQISVRRIATGGQNTTMRTWVRVPLTQDDQMRLLS